MWEVHGKSKKNSIWFSGLTLLTQKRSFRWNGKHVNTTEQKNSNHKRNTFQLSCTVMLMQGSSRWSDKHVNSRKWPREHKNMCRAHFFILKMGKPMQSFYCVYQFCEFKTLLSRWYLWGIAHQQKLISDSASLSKISSCTVYGKLESTVSILSSSY